jgi:hypothetical protein
MLKYHCGEKSLARRYQNEPEKFGVSEEMFIMSRTRHYQKRVQELFKTITRTTKQPKQQRMPKNINNMLL